LQRRRGLRRRPHLWRHRAPLHRDAGLVVALDWASGDDLPIWSALRDAVRAERPIALATVIDGIGVGAKLLVSPDPAPLGSLGDPDLDRVVGRDLLAELFAGRTSVRHYGEQGQANQTVVEVFLEAFAPPPRMLIFGAVDFTGALARVAKVLGYRVTV